jgi:hypothetical protein
MNVLIDSYGFCSNNIYFQDKKINNIINGYFTKMIYSTQYFTLNCIYLTLPLDSIRKEKSINKTSIFFNPFTVNNLSIIQKITSIEYDIIHFYKKMNQSNKNATCLLSKQLYSGMIKTHPYDSIFTNSFHYSIKISGIWEN